MMPDAGRPRSRRPAISRIGFSVWEKKGLSLSQSQFRPGSASEDMSTRSFGHSPLQANRKRPYAAGSIAAIGVVKLAGADEEAALAEEAAPIRVDEDAVCLDAVRDALARPGIFLLGLHSAPEEIDPHERRLSALPGDLDLGQAGVRLDHLPDVALLDFVGHAE